MEEQSNKSLHNHGYRRREQKEFDLGSIGEQINSSTFSNNYQNEGASFTQSRNSKTANPGFRNRFKSIQYTTDSQAGPYMATRQQTLLPQQFYETNRNLQNNPTLDSSTLQNHRSQMQFNSAAKLKSDEKRLSSIPDRINEEKIISQKNYMSVKDFVRSVSRKNGTRDGGFGLQDYQVPVWDNYYKTSYILKWPKRRDSNTFIN